MGHIFCSPSTIFNLSAAQFFKKFMWNNFILLCMVVKLKKTQIFANPDLHNPLGSSLDGKLLMKVRSTNIFLKTKHTIFLSSHT